MTTEKEWQQIAKDALEDAAYWKNRCKSIEEKKGSDFLKTHLLYECHYFIGEAIANTICAAKLEKNPDSKWQFKEDIACFKDLRKRLMNYLRGDE